MGKKRTVHTRIKRTKEGNRIEVFNHPKFATLNISASKEDWQRLRIYVLRDANFFYDNFIGPASFIFSPFRVTNKTKVNIWFSYLMKIQAGMLNMYFSYWFKKPVKERPGYIEKIEIHKEHKGLLNKKGRPIPLAYSAYCMQSVYGKLLKTYGILPFFNLENGSFDSKRFQVTYTIDGKNYLKGISADNLNAVHNLTVVQQNWIKKPEHENIFTLVHGITEAFLANYVPNYCNGMDKKELKTIETYSTNLTDIFTFPLI